MNARLWSIGIVIHVIAVAVNALPANGQSNPVFGLQSIAIDPPSGAATPVSMIMVDLSGVASTSLTPQQTSLSVVGPGTIEILLTTPGIAGEAVPTSWQTAEIPFPIGSLIPKPAPIQLQPGLYDIYARGFIGYGTASETEIGVQLVIEDYLVVPEPDAALLTLLSVFGLCKAAFRASRQS